MGSVLGYRFGREESPCKIYWCLVWIGQGPGLGLHWEDGFVAGVHESISKQAIALLHSPVLAVA